MNPTDRFTPAQAAPLLAHTEETIQRWCRAGVLHPLRIGRKVFVTGAEITRFLTDGPATKKAAPEPRTRVPRALPAIARRAKARPSRRTSALVK